MTTQHHGKKAAISWTGGKDCALAFYEAKLMGFEIIALVTFVPTKAKFLAHPLELMKLQAEAINVPHHLIEIKEPFKASYQKAIKSLREKHKIEAIITGDIAEVGGCTNWMQECSKSTGVSIVTPLWGRERVSLMNKLIEKKFEVILSGVKKPWFTDDWVGKRLTRESLSKLQMFHKETGLDVCGENGEYHTQVLDGPLFKKSIQIDAYTKREKDTLMYIEPQNLTLKDK